MRCGIRCLTVAALVAVLLIAIGTAARAGTALTKSLLVCKTQDEIAALIGYAETQERAMFFGTLGKYTDSNECVALEAGTVATRNDDLSSGAAICIQTVEDTRCRWAARRQVEADGL